MSNDRTIRILSTLCILSFLLGILILILAIHDANATYEYRNETGFNTPYGGKVFEDQHYIILYERCIDCYLKDNSWKIKDILLKEDLRWEARI